MITNKEKNFISAVVYVRNDAQRIAYFLRQLYSSLQQNFEKFEIICVNDASTDNSTDIIKSVADTFDSSALTIINMSFYQGLEPSMNAGVDLSIGDFVFEFDSNEVDYAPEVIMQVYRHSLQGYDIVSASNNRQRLSSKLFYKIYNKYSNTQFALLSETFRILSRRAINRIHSMSRTVPYRKALYSNCGLKVDNIIYKPTADAAVPRSREQFKKRQETAFDTLILFTNVAYRISMLMTAVMMIATLGGVIYTIAVFALGQPVAGYTTTMLVLTGSFFGVFAILAMIIKYLSVLVDLIFKKQKYIIESIEKITK